MVSHFSTNQLPERVKIVEVGPRDGLQNEKVWWFSKRLINEDQFYCGFEFCSVPCNRKLSQLILRSH